MSEKFDPEALAWFDMSDDVKPGHQFVEHSMILDYIVKSGELPRESAYPFAIWADQNWNDYDDQSGLQTNGQIIAGMLAYWRGM